MKVLVFASDDKEFLKSIKVWRNLGIHITGVVPTRSLDEIKSEVDACISENNFVRNMFESTKQGKSQYVNTFQKEYRVFCLTLDRLSFYSTPSMFSENLFNYFIEFALDFLKDNNFNKVILGNVAHLIHTVAFQVAVKILNLDIFHRELPAIGSGVIALWFKNGSNIYTTNSVKIFKAEDEELKMNVIINSINKISHGEDSVSRFNYMVDQSKSRRLSRFKYILYGLKFISFIPWLILVIRNKEGFLNVPYLSQFGLFKPYPSISALRKIFLQKKTTLDILFKEYENLSSNIASDLDYIYFPLHYQPEASTVPLGWPFHDQIYVAHKLADSLPNGFKLVIKEHSTQFHLNYRGDRGRWSGYYKALSSHPKILLAPIGQSSDKIIGNSKGVVSVNGSTVLESGVRFNKPSVVLANDTYHGLSKIRHEGKIENVYTLLKEIENDNELDFDVYKFVERKINIFFVNEVPNIK